MSIIIIILGICLIIKDYLTKDILTKKQEEILRGYKQFYDARAEIQQNFQNKLGEIDKKYK